MSFSVVILSKNAENLGPCMRAIQEQEQVPTKIIVVDDGVQWKHEALSGIAWWDVSMTYQFRGEKPFVFARNANIGIRAAGEHDVILLNDDALLETAGGFSSLAQVAAEHPEFGVISATTNVVGNLAQRPINGGGIAGAGCRGGALMSLREEPRTLAFVCVYIPRSTINRVGPLDERYCLDYGGEDNDYCEAVRRAGLKLGIFDGCYVDHGKLKSTFRGDPSRQPTSHRNLALFQQKWGHPA